MAKTLQFKRFSSTILANTVGASGELIIDSTKNLITVHDASTPGGWPVARESVINAINNAQSINIQQSRDTANLALVQANLAFVQINADLNLQGGLNSANANIGMLIGIQTTQNTNITTANNAAWASFNKANNALANTSGTFGGNLNVSGTMNVNNILTFTTSPPAASPSITTITTQNYNLALQTLSNTWTFGSNGNTTFPTGLVLGAPRGPNTVNFTAAIDKEFQIETGNSTTSKLWRFGTDGTTTFPTNISINYSGGNVLFPRIIADSGKAFSIQAQGNTGSAAMAWTVDPDAAGQYAQIGVTKNGGDNLAKILLSAQSDSSNAATAKTWVFNQTGAFTFPDATVQNTAFTGTAIDTLARTTSNTATNNITILQGVATTQNTNITTANNAAWAGYAQANVTVGGLNSANANIALILGVQTTQNTNIAAAAQTIPQNAQSTNYTLQLTDAGKHIYYTQSSNTTLYIPTTSNVAFANGSTIMIVSRTSSNANITVTPNTGVSMYLAGNTTSDSRNVTTYGMATLIQVAANTWFINGTGVS